MIQWLRTCLPMQGMQVQSLAGELIIHMLCGTDKKKKKNSFNWVSFLFFFFNIFLVVLGPRRYAQGFSS